MTNCIEGFVSIDTIFNYIMGKSYPTCAPYALVYNKHYFTCHSTCQCNLNTPELMKEFGPYYKCMVRMYKNKVR